ncbi:MAG: FtsX-like permease family protein [Pseudomonadota bacterium]
MRPLNFAVRSFGRELRSGEVLVLLSAVILAVGALTAVGFLTDRIGKAVTRQANEVLAADLRLRSKDPIPEVWRSLAADNSLQTATTTSMPSVVFAGDNSALSGVVAVSDGYPLRGQVRLTSELFGEQRVAEGIPPPGEVWVESSLLARVGADVGDTLGVGELDLTISAIVAYRPDQSVGFTSFAPTVLINDEDLAATGLVGEGSRVFRFLLVAGNEGDIEAFRDALDDDDVPAPTRVNTAEQSSERAFSAADRAKRFLSLTAVISLLLSAVAVAMSARRFALRRMDTVALMKSLGATQGFVIAVSLVQLVFLGIIGVAAGSAIGFAAEAALSLILSDIIAADLPDPGLMPVILAGGSAFVLLLGFALPSLLQLRETPPLRVLRHDAMPPSPSRIFVVSLSLAAVAALLYRSVGDLTMLVILLGGIIVISAALYAVGRVLVSSMGRFRTAGVGVAWRYGLANVARRGRASAVQVVAFGLGITVLLLLTLVRTDLLAGWQRTLTEEAPNQFMINIQRSEVASIRDIFTSRELAPPDLFAMVRARITTVNDNTVKEHDAPERWFLEREQNLSWAEQLDDSNELLAGEWWPTGYDGPPLVSIEEEAAMEANVALGDTLTFEVAGQEIQATVSSIRRVNWDSFKPNFFLVFSPGALDDYPATFIGSLRVEDAQRPLMVELVRKHPSVSIIDLDSILQQVREIIEKASLAVQAVFIFTLAAGIAVLFAAVQSTIDERRFESAMLRALGARKRIVFSGVMAEFAALGAAAGVLASAGATILAAVIAIELFELPYSFNPLYWVVGVSAGLLIVCASGYFAARSAINSAPVDVLRGAA